METKQREIKFRARDLDNKIYYFSVFDVQSTDLDDRYFYINGHSELMVKDTLEEFTGLKDKNGVPIFEGDLLRVEEESAPWRSKPSGKLLLCKWDEKMSGFGLERISYYGDDDYGNKHWIVSALNYKAEVIGNIYENPDLLSPKEVEG